MESDSNKEIGFDSILDLDGRQQIYSDSKSGIQFWFKSGLDSNLRKQLSWIRMWKFRICTLLQICSLSLVNCYLMPYASWRCAQRIRALLLILLSVALGWSAKDKPLSSTLTFYLTPWIMDGMEWFMASSTAQSLLAKVVREEVDLRTAILQQVTLLDQMSSINKIKFPFLEFWLNLLL